MRNRLLVPAALAALPLLLATACANSDSPAEGDTADRLTILTDIYPTTFAVQQVVGDDVEVIQLAPPGVEPHDYELSPQQVQQIADADLVAYVPGMIPAVEEAVEQEAASKGIDVTQGITKLAGHADEEGEEGHSESEGDWDPHVWLDPNNVAVMGANVADALTDQGSEADAADLQQDMKDLDEEMSAALADCAIKPLVVSHEAFGYLAAAYGFEQVGISGLSPDAEPSPARMAEITQLVQDEGITTIYFETLVSPAAAEAIASETGAKTALLDPVEGNTDDKGYVAIMQSNKGTLQTGQSCS